MADRTGPYEADDMVKVVDKTTGQVQEHPIPKAWIGTDLAPNVKQAGRTSTSSSDDTATGVPPASALKADLVAFAVEHGGMTEEAAEAMAKPELHEHLTNQATA